MTELNEEERRRRVDTGMYDAAFFMIARILAIRKYFFLYIFIAGCIRSGEC